MVTPFNNSPSLASFGKYVLAYLSVFLLFMMDFIPLHIGDLSAVRPPFFLIALFFWTVFRPSFLSPLLIFGLGLMADVISSYPLGITSIIMLVTQWGLKKQQRFLSGQAFLILWLGFFLTSTAVCFSYWASFSLLTFELAPFLKHATGYFLGLFVFPLLLFPLHTLNRWLTPSDETPMV